jgi:hypothetical protein
MTASGTRYSRRTDVAFGRYRIIAAESRGRYVAKLFLGRRQVLEREGNSVDSTIMAVKSAIERRDRERLCRRRDGVPTAEEFAEALEYFADEFPKSHLNMLHAHRRAPGRTLTSREIARAGGYKDYEAANLQYGLLGRKIAELLEYRPERRFSDDHPIWTLTLANGQRDQRSDLWRWTMHDELAKAMDELGW